MIKKVLINLDISIVAFIDSKVHHNGIKSRSSLIRKILLEWMRYESTPDVEIFLPPRKEPKLPMPNGWPIGGE